MSLLILSDIHGNWPALEAVLQTEPTPDAIVFCGDAVGPKRCQERMALPTFCQGLTAGDIPTGGAMIHGVWIRRGRVKERTGQGAARSARRIPVHARGRFCKERALPWHRPVDLPPHWAGVRCSWTGAFLGL